MVGEDSKILKRLIKYEELWAALSKLTSFVGLWDSQGVNLSAFRCLSIARHVPELVCYLRVVDYHSPQIGHDRATINNASLNHTLFTKVDAATQQQALDTVFNSDVSLIPTLSSFFANLR